MSEKPILFSGPMVRGIIDEIKTQTRRITDARGADRVLFVENAMLVPKRKDDKAFTGWVAEVDKLGGRAGLHLPLECKYGNVGDRLWVKETHWLFGRWYRDGLTKTGRPRWRFRADKLHKHAAFTPPHVKPKRTSNGWHKRPSIFMLRKLSRITLEITSESVERLQDISTDDAESEGATFWINSQPAPRQIVHPKTAFQMLWESINGKGSWALNPWVWAIIFRKL